MGGGGGCTKNDSLGMFIFFFRGISWLPLFDCSFTFDSPFQRDRHFWAWGVQKLHTERHEERLVPSTRPAPQVAPAARSKEQSHGHVKPHKFRANVAVCSFVCWLDCLFVCLFGWLVGCLVGWLVGWLASWLVGSVATPFHHKSTLTYGRKEEQSKEPRKRSREVELKEGAIFQSNFLGGSLRAKIDTSQQCGNRWPHVLTPASNLVFTKTVKTEGQTITQKSANPQEPMILIGLTPPSKGGLNPARLKAAPLLINQGLIDPGFP